MKTMTDLKQQIDYQQTDEHFINFLSKLSQLGVITLNEGDIVQGEDGQWLVSDALYFVMLSAYGIETEQITTDGENI